MNLVIDTHALLWLLTNDKKLSNRAKTIVRKSTQIFIPTIVLLELLYLLDKKDLANTFSDVLKVIKSDAKYSIFSLDIVTVELIAKDSIKLEMHDRVIVATAQLLGVAIVTRDRGISQFYQEVIW